MCNEDTSKEGLTDYWLDQLLDLIFCIFFQLSVMLPQITKEKNIIKKSAALALMKSSLCVVIILLS